MVWASPDALFWAHLYAQYRLTLSRQGASAAKQFIALAHCAHCPAYLVPMDRDIEVAKSVLWVRIGLY